MGLGIIASYNDGCYISLEEQTPGSLDGLQYTLVQLYAGGDRQIAPNGTAGLEIGVAWEKLQPLAGDPAVNIRLLGKGGTTKIIQNGAIAPGQRVCCDPASTGRIKALPDGLGGTTAAIGKYRCLGRKIAGTGNGAAGDIVEIMDLIESVAVGGVATLTESSGAIALACSGSVDQDQDAEVTLTANGTLTMTGLAAGMHGRLAVTQGGSGSYTLTLPSGSIVAGASSAGVVTLSTAVGKADLLTWFYDGTNIWWNAILAYK